MEPQTDGATKEEGLRLLKAGQVSDAIGVLGKVIASDPNDAQAHMFLGIACQQGGDTPRAAHHLQESIRLREDPRAYYNLGQVYESSNRADDAKIQYRRALILDANYANAKQALDRLEAPSRSAPVATPGLDQTQAVAPPPAMSQTQTMPPPAPVGAQPSPYGPPPGPPGGPPSYIAHQMEQQLKIQEAHNELMRNGLIYGSICGAILFVILGSLGAFLSFAMISPGSGIMSLIISAISGAIFGALIGLWMGYTCGDEMQGALAGAVLRALYMLVLGLIAGLPGLALFFLALWGALMGGIGGYIIGKLVDSSIGQV